MATILLTPRLLSLLTVAKPSFFPRLLTKIFSISSKNTFTFYWGGSILYSREGNEMIKNINDAFGECGIEFESLEEMSKALYDHGYDVPANELILGVDYEETTYSIQKIVDILNTSGFHFDVIEIADNDAMVSGQFTGLTSEEVARIYIENN
jgi:hypothetical protein